MEKPPFSLRTSARWLRRAAVLPGILLVAMALWLNHLAPMRTIDLAGMLFVAATWVGVVCWALLIRSPVVDIEEQGLRFRSGSRRLVPWAEISLDRERVDALELRMGTRRLVVQPSLYVQPDLMRRFVISRVPVGGTNILSPSEHKRQTRALITSGVAAAIGAALGALLLGRGCAS